MWDESVGRHMSARSGKALRIIMLVLAVLSVTAAATNGPVEGSLAAWTRQLISGTDDSLQRSAGIPAPRPDAESLGVTSYSLMF